MDLLMRRSSEDRYATKKIATGARYLDLRIIDHLVLGFDQYFSMADERIMPNYHLKFDSRILSKSI